MADPTVLSDLPWPLPQQAGIARGLLDRWSEPHRRYHDLRHLTECLAAAQHLRAGPDELLALWLHDAVHTGTPGRDEADSADVARRLLKGVLPPDRVEEVARLILLTRDHRPELDDSAGAIVCDADLWVLGADPVRYAASVQDLQAELELWGDAWRAVRRPQLEFRLSRPIYHSAPGREREVAARRNTSEELERLTG